MLNEEESVTLCSASERPGKFCSEKEMMSVDRRWNTSSPSQGAHGPQGKATE